MADDDYIADLVAWLPRLSRTRWRPWGFGPPAAPTAVAVLRRAPHATDVLPIQPEDPVMAYRSPAAVAQSVYSQRARDIALENEGRHHIRATESGPRMFSGDAASLISGYEADRTREHLSHHALLTTVTTKSK